MSILWKNLQDTQSYNFSVLFSYKLSSLSLLFAFSIIHAFHIVYSYEFIAVFCHSESQTYLKVACHLSLWKFLQKLTNLVSACSSASSLKSVARGWKSDWQNF